MRVERGTVIAGVNEMGLKARIGWALFAGSILVWAGLLFVIPRADGPEEVAAGVAALALASEALLWSAGLFLGVAFLEKRRGFLLRLFRRRQTGKPEEGTERE